MNFPLTQIDKALDIFGSSLSNYIYDYSAYNTLFGEFYRLHPGKVTITGSFIVRIHPKYHELVAFEFVEINRIYHEFIILEK